MAANLEAMGDFGSQELLKRLSVRLGKHRANDELQDAYRLSRRSGRPLGEVLEGVALPAELEGLDRPATGTAAQMVDGVVAAATKRRTGETDQWAQT